MICDFEIIASGDAGGYTLRCRNCQVTRTARYANYHRECVGTAPSAPVVLPGEQSGVGTQLKKLLSHLRLEITPGCPCLAHAAEMDARGIPWCRANIETIVDWLAEEAARRELPFVRTVATQIVKIAIWRAARAESKAAR